MQPAADTIYGVYKDSHLCAALQPIGGAIRGAAGGILLSHPAVRGRIHLAQEQKRLREALAEPDLDRLVARLEVDFEVRSTPRHALAWALR